MSQEIASRLGQQDTLLRTLSEQHESVGVVVLSPLSLHAKAHQSFCMFANTFAAAASYLIVYVTHKQAHRIAFYYVFQGDM